MFPIADVIYEKAEPEGKTGMSLPQGACVMELLSSVAQFSGHSHLLARTPMKLLTSPPPVDEPAAAIGTVLRDISHDSLAVSWIVIDGFKTILPFRGSSSLLTVLLVLKYMTGF